MGGVSAVDLTAVEMYVDPSCPWAWITCQWLREVAPQRDLDVTWRSYCMEIRDDYDVAPPVAPERRDVVIAAHVVSHRILRIFEAARRQGGEEAVDALLRAWGPLFFVRERPRDDALLAACVGNAGIDADLLAAADDEKWDAPIVESMDIAYAFGGTKTQTPTIVVRADPPYGFKGPVMAPAPTGAKALELWDAIQVIAREPGFFEITRPRRNPPRVKHA
jgi:2-hydroxychromene-2-carboxylate isomerase